MRARDPYLAKRQNSKRVHRLILHMISSKISEH